MSCRYREFSPFLKGQKVVSGKVGEELDCHLFGFVFSKYELIINCPWRIRNGHEILMGDYDLKASKITYKQIYE